MANKNIWYYDKPVPLFIITLSKWKRLEAKLKLNVRKLWLHVKNNEIIMKLVLSALKYLTISGMLSIV